MGKKETKLRQLFEQFVPGPTGKQHNYIVSEICMYMYI